MKKRRIIAFILALCLMFASGVSLISCGDDVEDDAPGGNEGGGEETKKEYSISLKDSAGNGVPSVVVTVFKDSEQVKMARTNESGYVKFDFTDGSYTFTLTFTGEKTYHYDASKCIMTEDDPSVTVTLAAKADRYEELYNGSKAYIVSSGSYYVEFDSESVAYFLYVPTERGRYRISVDSSVKATCSYKGTPMIIYDQDISNEKDVELDENGDPTGAIFMDFRAFNLNSTEYLFGVVGEGKGDGVFKIEKVSDIDLSPEELPYTDYKKTQNIEKFTFDGGNLVNFDITNLLYSAVYNEADGYYHLNSKDGPVIYIRLTVPTAYTESLEKICETQPFQHYLYDDDGKFTGKISYISMMNEYFAAADDTAGIYPLTNDLAVCIKDMGNYLGWFKPAAAGEEHIIFGNTIITDNVWLFACCYVQ